MDSLTQIVLGAAVGEVVLGRKVGNKAMLWGAIAGTIPDLDVLSRSLFDDLTANEMHRGFTHSILFSLIASPILAIWLKRHRRSLLAFFTALIALVFVQGAAHEEARWGIALAGLLVVGLVLWKGGREDEATVKDWSLLFWWSLVTHPLLDCHTTWGTQLLWPLPVKIAWNNIFVADPFYTVPFLICVVIAMLYSRNNPKRRTFNRAGILISSGYMLLTILLKLSAHQEITASLERQEYPYIELSTRPTPFNAILWTANVSMDSSFLLGYHSLLDTKPEVDFVSIPKNHALLGKLHDHPDIGRLIRLSQGRYVITRVNDTLIFNDLRFGQMGEPDKDKQFIFSYRLYERQGELQVERIPPPQVDGAEMGKILNDLVERIKGE